MIRGSSILSGDRKYQLALLSILILGFALRLYNLGYDSLWLDEAFTEQITQKSIGEIVSTTAGDVHPPLYYILMHFWLLLGRGEWMIRFPSVIFGVLSIFLTCEVARKFYGETEGLISAFLLSISYIHIHYSKEARMYSMLIFLTLLSIYFFYLALEDNRKKWWIVYTVASVLGVYTHYMMVAVIFAQAIYFLLVEFNWRNLKRSNSSKAKSFALSLIFVLVAYLPLLSMMLSALTVKAAGGNIFGVQSNIGFFHDVLGWFGVDFEFGGFETIFSILYVILFAIGIYASQDEYENRAILLVSWFIITIFFGFILAGLMHFMPRYVLHALPAYMILVARGIKETPDLIPKARLSPAASKALIALILAGIVIISYPHLANLSTQKLKEDWRECGKYLMANAKSGDVIIIEPGYNELPFSYYYNNSSYGTVISKPEENLTMIHELFEGNKRVWFVFSIDDINVVDRDFKIRQYIKNNAELKASYQGVQIFFRER